MSEIKKILTAVLFLILGVTAFSQEKIDQRVVKNKGAKAEESFRHNKNSYNYFLFELDNSYEVKATSELTKEEKKKLQSAANFKNSEGTVLTKDLIVPGVFNFYDFGIRLLKEERIYIALDKKTVLVFYSIPELSQLFKQSPGNTK